MANIKTIALSGAETAVYISGQNCDIRNDGTDTIYASAMPGVTAGADGVLSIPAGGAAKLLDTGGAVYLLGTGSVQLCGNDYAESVFKSAASASGGGGTEDIVARTAINTHAGNSEIHLTAEKAIEAAATAISNPNLLINPDFKVNQRGLTEYSGPSGYCVDAWVRNTGVTVNVREYGISLEYSTETNPTIYQRIENSERFCGKAVTISAFVGDTVVHATGTVPSSLATNDVLFRAYLKDFSTEYSDSDAHIRLQVNNNQLLFVLEELPVVNGAKLELGSVATPFVPPNPATELAKCQRYAMVLAALTRFHSTLCTGSVIDFFIPTSTTLRITPTIPTDEMGMRVRDADNTNVYSGFSLAVLNVSSNGFVVRATKENHGLTAAVLEIPSRLIISAEL